MLQAIDRIALIWVALIMGYGVIAVGFVVLRGIARQLKTAQSGPRDGKAVSPRPQFRLGTLLNCM
jgi:hypothetical protein